MKEETTDATDDLRERLVHLNRRRGHKMGKLLALAAAAEGTAGDGETESLRPRPLTTQGVGIKELSMVWGRARSIRNSEKRRMKFKLWEILFAKWGKVGLRHAA